MKVSVLAFGVVCIAWLPSKINKKGRQNSTARVKVIQIIPCGD